MRMLGCPKGTLGVLATGAAVPAAKIFLTNIATHATCETVSTDSGDYAFPAVAPGGYNLRVEHSSFKAAGSRNVQAQVQQTVRLDFTLLVGQVTESVEVSASAQMLQSENLSSGSGQAGSRQGGDRAIDLRWRPVLSGVARPGLPATADHQNFGVVTGTARSMPQLQLGLKVRFLRRTHETLDFSARGLWIVLGTG